MPPTKSQKLLARTHSPDAKFKTSDPASKATDTSHEPDKKHQKLDSTPTTDSKVQRQTKVTDFFTSTGTKPVVKPDDVHAPDETKHPSAAKSNVNNNNLIIDVPAILRAMPTEHRLAVHPSVGATWFTAVLHDEFQKPYFAELSRKLAVERQQCKIYPPEELVWTWSTFFDVSETKVVIIGQDPYHGAGQAHGLCFSVPPNVPVPASLRNIYDELENDVDGFQRPKHGCLRGWARQGVLLLNAVLTVRAGQPNSHQKTLGWEVLTDAVVHWLYKHHADGVVFMLWGQYAQAKCAKFGASAGNSRHLVLKAAHPSPLAGGKFKGCKHFSQANKWLMSKGKTPVDWNDLPTM